nr:transmembrane protease serine 11D-like [Parasteatoda tepidariorum]
MPFMCEALKGKNILVGFLGENKHQPAETVLVKRVIMHPRRKKGTPGTDIALLELMHSISCTEYTKPICVKPPENIIIPGKIMHVAGFGRTAIHNRSKELREGTSRIVDGSVCRSRFKKFLPSKELCAMANERTRVCVGDSGTSGFLEHKNKFYTVGVVSFGDDLCMLNKPAVFTKTGAYLDFIREHVKDLPKQPHG